MGNFVRALYGTRDAPLARQRVVKEYMITFCFEECKVTTGIFAIRVGYLRLVAHVDDYLASAGKHDLTWSKEEMAKMY